MSANGLFTVSPTSHIIERFEEEKVAYEYLENLVKKISYWSPKQSIMARSSPSSFSLQNLQTLDSVVNFKCTKQVLRMIPNLKLLDIQYKHTTGDYCLHYLVRVAKLETLRITNEIPGKKIQLPHSLKELALFECFFPWSELGRVVGSLPNLEVLWLKNYGCDGDVWEIKGEFAKLKVLEISKANLVIWKYDCEGSYIFPCLEYLELHRCRTLKEFPECIGEICTLRLIKVDNCNELLVKWAREVKEEQESYGNEYFQVIIKEYDDIDYSFPDFPLTITSCFD